MKRILMMTMTIMSALFILTACAQEEAALPTRAALAEVEATAPQANVDETAAPPAEPAPVATIAEEETEAGERPLLPNIADAPGASNLEAGLDSRITVASELAADTGGLFAETAFSLSTSLPAGTAAAQVWRQPAAPLDVNRAKAIAGRWGFTGPLYRLATPDEPVVGASDDPAAAPFPVDLPEYHVFDGTRSLVISEGAAYFADSSVPFDYETPQPFAQQAPAAEAVLQTMGLLDFPYTLKEGWGREVQVNRMVNGMDTGYPEISAGVAADGRLAFASYQPLDQLAAVAAYPLISAEAAWRQIRDGVDDNVLFAITPGADESDSPPSALPSGFQYWPREHQPGQEAHLYAYPTVFLPVDGGPPLVKVLNYIVQTDEETLRTLADQLGVNVHVWGILDVNSNALALTGWEPLPALNPLIKNGVIQRQGEQTLFIDQEGGAFLLPDAPTDLAGGSLVNIFAWAARDAGEAYPVLDWEGIDMQIAGSSGESAAMPEILPPAPPVYEQISITHAELAYYLYPEFQKGGNGRYQQTSWLLPVWQFTAAANNGDTVTFTVQATER